MFIVIKTHCRPLPVARTESHNTGIRPISCKSQVRRKTQLESDFASVGTAKFLISKGNPY